MKRCAPLLLLLLLLLLTPAWAEDEGPVGVACGLYALVDAGEGPKKNGPQTAYDGLRKGLELARLARVCLATHEPAGGGVPGLLRRLADEGAVPVFALGEDACAQVAASGVSLPTVMVVQRYSAGGETWLALPQAERAAVVYASMDVARLGAVLRAFTGVERPSVVLAARGPPAHGAAAERFVAGSGVHVSGWVVPEPPSRELSAPEVHALLHLRLELGDSGLGFEEALAWARAAGVPLVNDQPERFGQGAVVTLVAPHDLLGRVAAETARRMLREPGVPLAPRAVPGVEVWVDLKAADEQRIAVPLPFLARADRIRRGDGPPAGPTR